MGFKIISRKRRSNMGRQVIPWQAMRCELATERHNHRGIGKSKLFEDLRGLGVWYCGTKAHTSYQTMYTNDENIFFFKHKVCPFAAEMAREPQSVQTPPTNSRRECVWTGRKGKGVVLQASQLSLTALMILGERREGGMERNGLKARDVKSDTVWAGFQFRIVFLLDTFTVALNHFTFHKSPCWRIQKVSE